MDHLLSRFLFKLFPAAMVLHYVRNDLASRTRPIKFVWAIIVWHMLYMHYSTSLSIGQMAKGQTQIMSGTDTDTMMTSRGRPIRQ